MDAEKRAGLIRIGAIAIASLLVILAVRMYFEGQKEEVVEVDLPGTFAPNQPVETSQGAEPEDINEDE